MTKTIANYTRDEVNVKIYKKIKTFWRKIIVRFFSQSEFIFNKNSEGLFFFNPNALILDFNFIFN